MIFANCHPRGFTLIFSYIRRLCFFGGFFCLFFFGFFCLFFFFLGGGGGFKILNFNIFWGFQKNEYFLGIKFL